MTEFSAGRALAVYLLALSQLVFSGLLGSLRRDRRDGNRTIVVRA